jgi:hypothetical protein
MGANRLNVELMGVFCPPIFFNKNSIKKFKNQEGFFGFV